MNSPSRTKSFLRRSRLLVVMLFVVAVAAVYRSMAEPNPAAGPLATLKQQAGDIRYAKLVVAGDVVDKGIYDPSLAYAPDGRVGWLAYSSVKGAGNLVKGKLSLGQYVHTHLARTKDGGANWEFVKVLNASADGPLIAADGTQTSGVWRYEVPSLVFDPADPDENRRWKLFVHYYFWEPKRERMFNYGWIVLRTAADPAGEWSPNLPLFGAGKNPPAPYDKTQVNLNALDASLKNTAAYSEPGALAHDGRLYLSLTAVQPRLGLTGISFSFNIILLRSDDHAASWQFAGILLTPDDANRFGYEYFDGSSLAEDGGRVFLLTVPGGRGLMHDGCAAFEVESLAKGRLRRDARDQPIVANYFAPQPGILSGPGAGQATYHPGNLRGGLLFAQFNLKAYPEVFQIHQTGQGIVKPD